MLFATDGERANSVTYIVIVSVFSVVSEDPTELLNDSSNSVYVLTAAVDVSIVTVAEDAPFAMVTNGTEKALIYLRSI